MLFAASTQPAIEVSGWVATVLTVGAVFAAVSAIVALVVKSRLARPLRWAFRQLVGEPVTTFVQLTVGEIVEAHVAPLRYELTPNSGNSLVDKVNKLVLFADDSNARLIKIEQDRSVQLPIFEENSRKLDELHAYTHDNIHDTRGVIQELQTKNDATASVVRALGETVIELKATRAAIDHAKGEAATVVESARVVAEDVLREARVRRDGQ